MMPAFALLLAAAAAANTPLPPDAATVAAIEATCFDYVDGQLEANPERVARSLHPDLAKRMVLGDTPDERLGLRRMSREELVGLTRQGALKTPKTDWNRSCRVLDVTANAASVRLETPWFVDYFHMGRFGERWIIVNALWYSKPAPTRTLPVAREGAAQRVGEGWLSGNRNDYNLSLDASGQQMVFARSAAGFKDSHIWFAQRDGRGWTEPAPVPFSDPRYKDSDPWLTPDGGTLYFVSNRPVSGETPNSSLDIWRVAAGAGGFGTPEHLAAVASTGDELGPELHDGVLYFNSARSGGPAQLSIYRAQVKGRSFDAPQALAAPFNDGRIQGDFTLAPDGQVAVFWSRRGESPEVDLFASCKGAKGWSPAIRLPAPLNGTGMDFTPAFSADGSTLYFASLRGGDGAADPNGVLNGQSNLYTVPAALVYGALAKQASC
jgi:hypothetical protein